MNKATAISIVFRSGNWLAFPWVSDGTLAGMAPKERTTEAYAAAEKKYGMVYEDNTR